MSNYIEFNDSIAFHPGYYIEELVEESGLTQKDFAARLGTTPKNLSQLINGKQSLSIDMATKLARMYGTSIPYWLNLQQAYDEKLAEILSAQELEKEKIVFSFIDYKYFRVNFGLPDLPRKISAQIKEVREFLGVASLTVLQEQSLAVSFRSYTQNLSTSNIVNANAMVQMAINLATQTEAGKYNEAKFRKAVDFALSQTQNHDGFLEPVTEAFKEAGVVLVVLPNLKNSGINGATKKLGDKVLLMVNDRRHFADTFWFTLFHEIGHILNGDLGVTFDNEAEDDADRYAKNALIPAEPYEEFIKSHKTFDEQAILSFAQAINQDPGIIYGRLQKDGKIPYEEKDLAKKLRIRYEFGKKIQDKPCS